jgi:transposase
MQKTHVIQLTEAERQLLTDLTRRGRTSPRRVARARILLLAEWNRPDRAIAAAVGVHPRTVERVRQRAATAGVLAAVDDQPRPGGRPKLDDRQTAHLIALACSDAPAGREHWTMQLLADRLVTLGVVEAISDETVRRTLKKTA